MIDLERGPRERKMKGGLEFLATLVAPTVQLLYCGGCSKLLLLLLLRYSNLLSCEGT